MGKASDLMAVVDSQARGFGVQSLRVVDASSFALLPPGHPQSAVCESNRSMIWTVMRLTDIIDALAEKIAADMSGL